MRKEIKNIILVLLILAVLAFSVSAAEIHLTYKRPADNLVVAQNTTDSSINITLPKTDLNLDIENENRTFKLSVPSLSIATVAELNISERHMNPDTVDNITIPIGPGRTYVPRMAYAFRIDNEEQINGTYTAYMYYANASVTGSYALVLFKFGYNFTTNQTDYSTYTKYTTSSGLSVDTTNKIASFTITNFSSFVLAEDTSTPAPTTPSGPSGGGGGGGGSTQPVLITVTPTYEGVGVSAPVLAVINVIYKDKVYPLEFVFANTIYIKLKNKDTGDYWTLVTGFPKKIDLDKTGGDDIEVLLTSMSKKQGTFVFTLLGGTPARQVPSILPAPSRRPQQPAETSETTTQQTQPTTPTAPAAVAPVVPGAEQIPSGPISVWTIMLALLFIIVLVGGVALYRRHLSMDKPPAAIRTGLGRPLSETELPPTTEKPRPAPDLLSGTAAVSTIGTTQEEKEEEAQLSESDKESLGVGISRVEDTLQETQQEAAENIETKPVEIVPPERIKMLEKYIYHGLAQGYSAEQMRSVLESKGWPNDLLDDTFEHISFTDEHIEAEDLHTHNDVELAVEPVKQLLEKGFDEEHIRQGLKRKGWTDEQIDGLFSRI